MGIGEFGIKAVGEWMSFLHTRLPEALPFVRVCGLCRPESDDPTGKVPHGRIRHGQLEITSELWVDRLKEAAGLELFVKKIRRCADDLSRVEPPAEWPVRLEIRSPRVILVASTADPTFSHWCFPEMASQNKTLVSAIQRHLLPVLVTNGIVGVLFIDQPDGVSFKASLKGIAEAQAKFEGKGLSYLISCHGWQRSGTGDILLRSMWQATNAWDEDYCKGACCYARHLLLLLLRAGEAGDHDSVAGCLGPHENRAPHFYATGLGMVLEPGLEVRQYHQAQWLRHELLGKLLGGPVEVELPTSLPEEQDNLPATLSDLITPEHDPNDPKYLESLVGSLVVVPRPSHFKFDSSDSPALAELRSLNLETLSSSDVAWWTGKELPVNTEELLRRIQQHCLKCLQAALHWRDFLARMFRQSGDAVKAGYDASLRNSLALQERAITALAARRLTAGGLSKSRIQVLLEKLLQYLHTQIGHVTMTPPKPTVEIDKQFAERVRQLVFALRVEEQVSRASSLAYACLASTVLGVGLSYAVYGFCHEWPRALLYACLSFLVGPVCGALFHFKGQRDRVARERSLQAELFGKGKEIVSRVELEMRRLADEYCKAYERLYRLRAERALRRLLQRTSNRLRVAEQVVKDRCVEIDQRLRLLGQLPELRAPWVKCTSDQQTYLEALRLSAYPKGGANEFRPSLRLPVPSQPFEDEPFQSTLGKRMMETPSFLPTIPGKILLDRLLVQFGAAFQECQKGPAYPEPTEEADGGPFVLLPKGAADDPSWQLALTTVGLQQHQAFAWSLEETVLFARVWRIDPFAESQSDIP